jgi:hypothetical protein
VENFLERAARALPVAGEIWLENLLAKKFQLGYPLTEYIATRLADGTLSLKNFKPSPGAKLSSA